MGANVERGEGERDRQASPCAGVGRGAASAEEAGRRAQPSRWLPLACGPRSRGMGACVSWAACLCCAGMHACPCARSRVMHGAAGTCAGWASTGGCPNRGQPLPDRLYQQQQPSHRSCL